LYGIKQKFNHYKYSLNIRNLIKSEALEMILATESPDDEDLEDERCVLTFNFQIFRDLSRSNRCLWVDTLKVYNYA
jgi:hypothetical protein